MDLNKLELELDSFVPEQRIRTLKNLRDIVRTGKLQPAPPSAITNLHAHSFFSYNAYGYSPAHIVWLAYKHGLESVGTIEFDVLDNVEETIISGDLLGIKAVAGIESRVFVKDYRSTVINSPNEPGIVYYMGTGFYRNPTLGTDSAMTLTKMKSIAHSRNREMLNKINRYLTEITVDYDKDVIPLTPAGNVTERHLLAAIDKTVKHHFATNADKLLTFWSDKLKLSTDQIKSILNQEHEFYELLRTKLMKFGSIGYIVPEPKNFPTLDEMVRMIIDTDGLPTATWLDGTNDGEKIVRELLEFYLSKGTVVLNIIPDRNWNIKDINEKTRKVANLHEVIRVAKELDLPLIAGTEMNKNGQKFVDEFTVPELNPYLNLFRDGAFLVYGHTQLAKLFNKGYNSIWAEEHFPDRKTRNKFYILLGKLISPDDTKPKIEILIDTQVALFMNFRYN